MRDCDDFNEFGTRVHLRNGSSITERFKSSCCAGQSVSSCVMLQSFPLRKKGHRLRQGNPEEDTTML